MLETLLVKLKQMVRKAEKGQDIFPKIYSTIDQLLFIVTTEVESDDEEDVSEQLHPSFFIRQIRELLAASVAQIKEDHDRLFNGLVNKSDYPSARTQMSRDRIILSKHQTPRTPNTPQDSDKMHEHSLLKSAAITKSRQRFQGSTDRNRSGQETSTVKKKIKMINAQILAMTDEIRNMIRR